jgi:hypothetical protein
MIQISKSITIDYDRHSQVNRSTWFISTAEQRDAWVVQLHLRRSFTSSSASQVCQCRLA